MGAYHHLLEERWPVWACILFVLVASLALWALIMAGIWLIA